MSICRDCADNDGTCPHSGKPCDPNESKQASWRGLPDLRDDEPCKHAGCLSHVSHPCEGCGRVAGRTPNVELRGPEAALSPQAPSRTPG